MKKLSLALLIGMCVAHTTITLGQLIERPFSLSPTSNNSQARIKMTEDTLILPFFEDFSQSIYVADNNKWDSTYLDVMVNSSIGIAPPSINVATFDGWNQFGNPHNPGDDAPSPLRSDSLISKAINLSGLGVEDSVKLTFYWQQEGHGDNPESEDQLILSFFGSDSIWVDRDSSFVGNENNRTGKFQYESIHIKDQKYLHSGFKFKFVSSGNPKGPYDVWHVDYITLDKENFRDVQDVAISTTVSSIFKEITMMPMDHFFAYSEDIMETSSAYVSNLRDAFTTVDLTFRILEQETDNIIDSHIISSYTFEAYAINEIIELKESVIISYDNLLDYASNDSLYLYSEFIMSGNNEIPLVRTENDTSRVYFNLHETLAYDDGSAEYVAGINQSGGQLAVQFSTPVQDTVTAVDIYFPVVYPLPDPGTLSIRVLKDLTEKTDTTTLGQEFSVTYSDTINQFVRFEFDEPIIISDTFYISMTQFTNNYVAIGLDKNTNTASRIFFKTGNDWEQNSIDNVKGSLMFRAIFAKANIEEDTVLTFHTPAFSPITLYPNPANSYVEIDGLFEQYEMYDMLGERVLQGNSKQIDLNIINKGIYILRFHVEDRIIMKRIVLQ
ncbi:MAG: T9SS type A sorting domain-containing protein [Reichenbachiella sp.]